MWASLQELKRGLTKKTNDLVHVESVVVSAFVAVAIKEEINFHHFPKLV